MKIDEANGKRIVQKDLDDTRVLIGTYISLKRSCNHNQP